MSDYNGWKNYETWLVKLWLDNDEGIQQWLEDNSIESLQNAIDINDEIRTDASLELSFRIKAYIEENIPSIKGIYSDLLNLALSEVDYREIADTVLIYIPVYSACWNMQGCPHESKPACFLSHEWAIDYLVDAIEGSLELDEFDSIDADRAIEELKATKDGSEVCVAFKDYVYSVSVL
jgi:hypothetical protein